LGSVEDENTQSTPSDRSDSIKGKITTEPLSFLTGWGKSSPDDPFWGQSPRNYPSLEEPNDSASSHNRFTAPVNRSHKLLLALKAVKKDQTHASPFSERGLEIVPALQAADQPPRQETVPAVIKKKGWTLNKPSIWNILTHGVLQIVRRKKKSKLLQKKYQSTKGRNTVTIEEEPGRTVHAKKSLRNLFNLSPTGKFN
jgi:hypothetical protein